MKEFRVLETMPRIDTKTKKNSSENTRYNTYRLTAFRQGIT